MPRYICKVIDPLDNKEYYLEWSTVVDAPVTFGMTLDEFTKHHRHEYGRKGHEDFEERMKRVNMFGTSSREGETFAEMIKGNRAGRGDTELTMEQIVYAYCRCNINVNDELPVGSTRP